MKPTVVLVSGGMDSAVVLAIAREQGFAPHALSVRYGQRHTSELDAAVRVAASKGDGVSVGTIIGPAATCADDVKTFSVNGAETAAGTPAFLTRCSPTRCGNWPCIEPRPRLTLGSRK